MHVCYATAFFYVFDEIHGCVRCGSTCTPGYVHEYGLGIFFHAEDTGAEILNAFGGAGRVEFEGGEGGGTGGYQVDDLRGED